ncbi:MAG: hypothetical protein MUO63_22305 [Desulfobulbaceae bacterium]|nr:hypothetical protein [Desulfobulbaceae bacterium]
MDNSDQPSLILLPVRLELVPPMWPRPRAGLEKTWEQAKEKPATLARCGPDY